MAYQSKYTGLEIDDILDSVEWKQGKIEDLASIRAGAQKGATALQSYTEKYTGTVTGIKLNGVVKSGSGVIDLGTISTTETDPIFSASPAASITEAKKAEWDGKQDKIADLASIRSGAEKGATALQSIPSEYVTETELTNKGYATTSSLNNKVDKVNGKQLSTEDFTTALKTKLEGLSNYDDTELSNAVETLRGDFDNIVSGDTTTAIKTFNEVIAFLDGLTDTQDLESIIANIEQQIAGKMDKVTLATVATSGSYNDLSNKPTIPSAVTESTVSGWGFTKNAGTYSKPSTGIPKTDLASAVQTSLGKADTAVQPAAISDFIKGVAINGTTIANTSGTVYLPNASTGGYGVTRLNSNINSTSTMEAATPSAVKAAYDLANGKQDKLVSGTNIKTINGTSILGSGNIEISGGGSGGSGEDNRYFTNFTVEEFIEGCVDYNTITNSITELSNAVNNNKIVCVPYNNHECGFLIATYKKYNSEDCAFHVYFETEGKRCLAYCTEENDFGDPVGLFGNGVVAYVPQIIEVEVSEDGNFLETYDNIYHITGEINYLAIIPSSITNSSTVRFTTGSDSILEIYDYILWANGNAPVLEPYTSYELSIALGYDGYYGVLVPFKYVE